MSQKCKVWLQLFFSWKLKENKDSKLDDNFNTSNMTWTGHKEKWKKILYNLFCKFLNKCLYNIFWHKKVIHNLTKPFRADVSCGWLKKKRTDFSCCRLGNIAKKNWIKTYHIYKNCNFLNLIIPYTNFNYHQGRCQLSLIYCVID